MSNSVEVFGELDIDREGLELLVAVNEFYEDNRASLMIKLGLPLPENLANSETALTEVRGNASHVMYDLRRASEVANLEVSGFHADPEEYSYEIQDDDAFVLFLRDGSGDWVDRRIIIMTFDGEISYAKQLFHGPFVNGGYIGDGEYVKDDSPNQARTILRNMMIDAKPVPGLLLIQSDYPLYRDFAFEMWQHSQVDEQRQI